MGNQKWIIAAVLVAVAYAASAVLVPFFLALFLAVLLEPLVRIGIRLGAPRAASSLLISTLFVVVSAIAVWGLYQYLLSLGSDLPLLKTRLETLFANLDSSFSSFKLSEGSRAIFSPEFADGVQKVQLVEKYPFWSQYLMRGVGTFSQVITLIVFVPILLNFILIDKENLIESFNAVIGRYIYLPKLNSELPIMVRSFFAANFVTGTLLAAVHSLALYVLGFNGSVILGVVSGFANLIPLLGAPIALGLIGIQALLQFDIATPYLIAGFIVLTAHGVTGNILLPYLVGTRVNVSSVAMAIGLLFWSWLWGAVGFLLAVPMTALVKIALESSVSTHALANLLAAKPRLANASLLDDDSETQS